MEPEDKTPPGRRRGCFGCLFTGTLGCGAFLFGAAVAAALFAPSLLGGFVARALRGAVNGEIDGSIEIEELELAWNDVQVVRGLKLRDPEGLEVLDLTAQVPSLFQLWDDGATELPVEVTVHSARIAVGTDGTSNLERALEQPRRRRSARVQYDVTQRGQHSEDTRFSRITRIALTANRVEWRDDRDPGASVDVRDVRLSAQRAGDRLELDGSAGLGGEDGDRGELRLEGTAPDPSSSGGASGLDLHASVTGLPVAVLEALLASDGLLAELLGGSVDLTLDLRGDGDVTTDVRALARAGQAQVELEARLAQQRFALRGDGLRARLPLRPAFDRALEPVLPPGTSLRYAASDTLWELVSQRAELPLDAGGAPRWAELALEVHAEWAGRVELVDVDSERTLGGLEAFTGSAVVGPDAPVLVKLEAQGVESEGRAAGARSRVELELDGALVHALVPGVRAGAPIGKVQAFALSGELLGRVLPALDALTRTFGGRVDLDLGWSVDPSGAQVDGEVRSSNAELRWSGRLEDGDLLSGEDGTLVLEALPTVGLCADVVQPLVPWIAHLEPVAGVTTRARLSAAGFNIPLGSAIAAASAEVEVDLGRAIYGYSPGFLALFGDRADQRIDGRIAPFDVRLGGGRARYEGLVLEVEGRPCSFRGSADPETGEILFDAEVPVSLLGQRMGMAADSMGDTAMPLQVSGRWDAPVPAVPIRLDSVLEVLREGPGLLQDRATSTWTRLIDLFSGDAR